MLDFLKPETLAAVVVALVITNAALWAIHGFLEKIKDITKSEFDNKAASIIYSVATGIQKIIDIFGMNPKHK